MIIWLLYCGFSMIFTEKTRITLYAFKIINVDIRRYCHNILWICKNVLYFKINILLFKGEQLGYQKSYNSKKHMLEKSLFYTVDCWYNINLWCKIIYAKSIAYITTTYKKIKLASKFFWSPTLFDFFLLVFGITNRNFTAIVENGLTIQLNKFWLWLINHYCNKFCKYNL